jgi:hypothetical protein
MSTTPTTPPREITDDELDIPVTPGKSLSTEYLLSLQTAISVSVRSPVSISPPTSTLTRNQRKRVLKNKNLRQGSLRLSVNGLPDPVKERQLERQSARVKRRAKQDLKEGLVLARQASKESVESADTQLRTPFEQRSETTLRQTSRALLRKAAERANTSVHLLEASNRESLGERSSIPLPSLQSNQTYQYLNKLSYKTKTK